MCEPTTLLIGATAVAALGSVASGVMAYQQGQYQNKVAKRNADLATESARDALARGREESLQHGRRTAQLRGAQTAALAASGVDVGFGSALDLVGDSALIASEDARAINENAVRESKGFSISAANYRSQGKAAKMEGTGKLVAGFFDAGSTILGGASQVSQMKAARMSQNAGTKAGKWGDAFTTYKPKFATPAGF